MALQSAIYRLHFFQIIIFVHNPAFSHSVDVYRDVRKRATVCNRAFINCSSTPYEQQASVTKKRAMNKTTTKEEEDKRVI